MKKNKIIIALLIFSTLIFVFWYGGNAPGLRGWKTGRKSSLNIVQNNEFHPKSTKSDAMLSHSTQPITSEPAKSEIPIKKSNEVATEDNKPQKSDKSSMTAEEKEALAERIATENESSSPSSNFKSGNTSQSDNGYNSEMFNEDTTDKYYTDPIPTEKPSPVEPQDVVISDQEHTCTLSVKCDTILDNIAWLDEKKRDILPKDGIIFPETTVTFYDGESVFNLLVREMKRNKIHLEFENTPIYNSAYIEGISNIYEFDCGELSGWMYKVNDWFPNYGSSRYQLKPGDKVEFVYTCDLGVDVGGNYSSKNGR